MSQLRNTSSDDKFWKVRPLLGVIRSRCLQLEELEQNCIDEQMVAFSWMVPAKQAVKSKPNPVGVKIFVRCSTDGLSHDFELYQGKGTGIDREFSFLGLRVCVVMRLVESFPRHRNLKLFFDNYFTSVLLLRELKSIGILATGTIRSNGLPGCQLKGEKEMRKDERGSTNIKVTEAGDVALVRWKDNNLVTVASTQVSTGETKAVSRWSSSKKERIEVERPQAILEYNRHMGGVDKLDFIMPLYHIRAKTKKIAVKAPKHLDVVRRACAPAFVSSHHAGVATPKISETQAALNISSRDHLTFVTARQRHQPASVGSTTPRRHSGIPTARSTSGGTSG
ncbi:hypothetical protein HPB51_020654 [Rhipicephalus microplus]|uniref:PiggyBac transposable element-derived protein domain-containing protein n=1 Tax=Rhipicephalus microplus TaxID=6941 RepID=A0A9J6DP21_RHIMP|nr:hypothetical protein HPB51_020654 [Rhipicephalus microplus]